MQPAQPTPPQAAGDPTKPGPGVIFAQVVLALQAVFTFGFWLIEVFFLVSSLQQGAPVPDELWPWVIAHPIVAVTLFVSVLLLHSRPWVGWLILAAEAVVTAEWVVVAASGVVRTDSYESVAIMLRIIATVFIIGYMIKRSRQRAR